MKTATKCFLTDCHPFNNHQRIIFYLKLLCTYIQQIPLHFFNRAVQTYIILELKILQKMNKNQTKDANFLSYYLSEYKDITLLVDVTFCMTYKL